jgi:CHAT domain-containing protein
MLKLPAKSANKTLIIVPDGVITFVPFDALITQETSTTNFAKMQYLMNDYVIGYSNSAAFYLNAIPFQKSSETVLGIFPVFQNSPLELSFSKKELENIKKNFDGKFLDNQQSTFDNFKLNAPNYSILHLSTHASSGDIVEPASIKFYDKDIFYSELYSLHIQPNLVVLSACETGLGKLYKAEGAMSVARGFQFAGAQNLLFSLWKVNDYTTSVLMSDFYKNIKKGNSYIVSNHQSKIDFLNNNEIPNTKKSPYYWAAFVYYGTLEKSNSNNTFVFLIIGAVITIVTIWLFLYFKRKKANARTT